MDSPASRYDQINLAVGKTATTWIRLEGSIRHLILAMAVYLDEAFERDGPLSVLGAFAENMEVRATIASAKVLAHQITDPADFYDRASALLNKIDNEYRNERNRYVHDLWALWGEGIKRIKLGTSVKMVQSRQREISHFTERNYASVDELHVFAGQLMEANGAVQNLVDELYLTLERLRPLSE